MKRTLLVDGDVCVFQACAATNVISEFDGEQMIQSNNEEAKASLAFALNKIMENLSGTHMIIAISDPTSGYWRKEILPTYKGNRKGMKPLGYSGIRQWMINNYNVKFKPTLEGDDVLGILSTHPSLVKGEKIIVSVDKDMYTIPGLFCRNLNGNWDIENISPSQADYNHMLQTLTGDTTDGYTGCPGVGPVKARAILAEKRFSGGLFTVKQAWPFVVAAFEKAGLTEADALVQARVSRILRWDEYDYNTKKGILWTPPEGSKR